MVWKGFPAFPAHLRMRPVSLPTDSLAAFQQHTALHGPLASADIANFGFLINHMHISI